MSTQLVDHCSCCFTPPLSSGTVNVVVVVYYTGTFMAVTDSELEKLKSENRLTVEVPKAMGGKVTDLTQKPIVVLREE